MSRRPRVVAFAAYLLLGLLSAGFYAIRDPSRVCACVGNADPALFMWSLGWWPHALTHGLNPLVSNYVWTPVGVNLAQHTTIPTAALAAWPLTATLGPVVSYNVLAVASPVLAAFACYLLCRRLSGSELAGLAGGYIFGFGPYMFSQLVGHLNLTLVFLVPVMVHLALRRAEREISSRVYVAALAAVLALQVGLSTEVLFTSVAIGGSCLAAAFLLVRAPYRRRIAGLLVESALAGLGAVAIASPFIYYALVKGAVPHEAPAISDQFGLDLLNLLVPTHATLIGGSGHLGGGALAGVAGSFEEANIAEADGYLSLPIVLAFLAWAATSPRRAVARMAAFAAAVSLLAALGSHLHVGGSQSIPLPYDLIRGLPVVSLITPSRIVMYTSLALAVGVSVWLGERRAESVRPQVARAERAGPEVARARVACTEATGAEPAHTQGAQARVAGFRVAHAEPGGGEARGRVWGIPTWGRWAVVAVGLVLVFPNIPSRIWGQRPANPAFFRTSAYRRHLRAGATVLALPFAQNGNSMLWQAESGFYFKMPEGYLGHFAPRSFASQPVVAQLGSNAPTDPVALVGFLRRYHVRDVVIDRTPGVATPYEAELATLGLRGIPVGEAMLYVRP